MEKGYLEREFTPRFGTQTKPAVYHLSAKGRAYIRSVYEDVSPKYLARLRDDNQRSKGFRSKWQIRRSWHRYISVSAWA